MKYLKLFLCLFFLFACTSKKTVDELYMNLNTLESFDLIEEEYIDDIVEIVSNDYVIPQEEEKDIEEFKGMDVLFIKYTMDNKNYAITIYEDGYGYIVEDDNSTYVKYDDGVFSSLKEYVE